MGGNVIITRTTNVVDFKISRGSYQRTVDRIKQVGKEWDKVASKMKPLRLKFEENGYTKVRRKQHDDAAKAATKQAREEAKAARATEKARIASERKIQTIRAKGIRFSTAAANANVTPAQRAGHLQEFGQLTRQYHAGSMALQEYNARVSRLQQTMRQQGRVGMRGASIPVTAKVNKLDTSMIEGAGGAITIAATVALSGKIMTTGQDFAALESTLLAVTGDSDKAAKEMDYLRDQANRLGLDLLKVGKEYAKFSAATQGKLSDSQTKNVFEGLSEYGTVLGLTAEESSRALLALQQMASKSKVSMEELRQQFGDAVPKAIGIFTDAYNQAFGKNVTEEQFQDLVGQGKVLAKDVLPAVGDQLKKLARNGGALDKAMKSNRASWQRLQTSMQNAMNVFFTSGFGNSLTNAFDSISAAIDGSGGAFEMFGHIAGKIVEGATDAFTELHDTVIFTFRVIEYYAAKMGISGEQLKAWGEMAAYAAGVALFAGSIYKLGGAFKWVLTMLNPLTKLLGVMKGIAAIGGIDAASEALGDGKPGKDVKPGKPGTPSKNTKPVGAGRGVNFGLPAIIAAVSLNDRLDQIQADPEAFKRKVQQNNDRPTLWADIKETFSGSWYEKQQNANQQAAQTAALDQTVRVAVPTFTPPTTETVTGGYGNALMAPPAWLNQPLNVNVNVKVQDGQVKDLVRSEVEANDNRNFNMLMQGGPN